MKRLTITSILLTVIAMVAVGCSAKEDIVATPDSSPTLSPLPSTDTAQPSVGTSTQSRDAVGISGASMGGADTIGTLPEAETDTPRLPAQ